MRGDNVYRFLVIRDPEAPADGRGAQADPRLVEALRSGPTTFLVALKDALEAGDVRMARDVAENRMDELSRDRGLDSRVRAAVDLRRRLRSLVHAAGGDALARGELDDLELLGVGQGADRSRALDDFRGEVVDLLVASIFTQDPFVNRSAACSAILALEAGARLLATGRAALPWRPAVSDGRVILPFDLTPAIRAGAREKTDDLAVLGPPEVRNVREARSLTPAQLVASGAVRTYVGDLVILDQQLRRYSLGEVAHVENVLASEKFERVRRDLHRVAIETSESVDSETLDERDLQTTERDELRSELTKAVRENLHVGAEISATVTGKTPNGEYAVAAGASFAYDRASEQREERAQSHARELVDRARQQITERTKRTRTTIMTSEDENTTTHGFDNQQADAEHIVGVYRWIEKEYDLHLINLGRRLFYEVVIPEPAAFWKAMSSRRTEVAVGPPPARPALAGIESDTAEPLSAAHLALRDSQGERLERPSRWLDLVALAGEWGVELPEPPASARQLSFQLSVAPMSGDTSEKAIHAFGGVPDPNVFYYEGVEPRSAAPEKPPAVPEGYEAVGGEVAVTGQMVVGRTVSGVPQNAPYATRNQYERGTAFLQMGGRQEVFAVGFGGQGELPVTRDLTAIFAGGVTLSGELPVVLSTNLNSALANVRLDCRRTRTAEMRWTTDVLDRFATAYAERVAARADAARASMVDQRQRDYLRSEASFRDIERRELKRQVIDLLVGGRLESIGADVTTPAGSDASGHVRAGEIDPARLPFYTRAVNFFEQAFDWSSIVAAYGPYFYGRPQEWESAALTDDGDARFTAFLSAGAARVQVPAQLGYEAVVEAFFADLGPADPGDAFPWLPTGRPIALDLAGAARGGFERWPGTLTGAAGSARVVVNGNTFDATADTGRELRIDGRIFRIVRVVSVTEVELDRPLMTQVDRGAYERGGLVLGPPITLRLPSSLVAIDTGGVQLPTFAGRYA